MTTTPYQYITLTGVIVADTSATLSEVQLEWQQAFGADLIVTADTPQGVMITAEALARNNVINNNAALANQINPNIAGGVFFDAIWALTGGQRQSDEPTYVPGVVVTGSPGLNIPKGSQAYTAANDYFQTVAAITLDSSGNGVVDFESIENGPIPCATGALDSIAPGVLGWETVYNANPGELGTTVQSDPSSRAARKNTLALNGISLIEAISSAVYNVPDVLSVQPLENIEAAPMGMLISVTGGATLAGTIWGMTNTTDTVVVGTNALEFAQSSQTLPTPNPWPIAVATTTGNIALTGLGTQSGGDWAAALTAGQYVLVKNQTTATQNGVYVVAAGAWSLQAYNATGNILLGSNNGISLKANSIWFCVDGGNTTAVAAAMLENKSGGCAWNGGTSVSLIEPTSGQTYLVLLDRPTLVPITVNISVKGITAQAAQQAILDYAAGTIDGLTGFVTGMNVSPFELGGAVMAENPGAYVASVTVAVVPGSGSPSYSTNPISIALNQKATVQQSAINVTLLT